VIAKYDAIAILKNMAKFSFASKTDFAASVKLDASHFVLTCNNKQLLQELRICYNLDKPGN
jgi:hypothetical protein